MSNDEPTETSPLLSKLPAAALEPGDAPEGALPFINGHDQIKAGNDDVERQDVEHDRAVQYEGLPEVKKRLKYIVPAVAVGVSLNS